MTAEGMTSYSEHYCWLDLVNLGHRDKPNRTSDAGPVYELWHFLPRQSCWYLGVRFLRCEAPTTTCGTTGRLQSTIHSVWMKSGHLLYSTKWRGEAVDMLWTNCMTDCSLLALCCSLPCVWREWGGRLILMFIVHFIHALNHFHHPLLCKQVRHLERPPGESVLKVYVVPSIRKYEINKCENESSLFTRRWQDALT